jgi:hypothetical protein
MASMRRTILRRLFRAALPPGRSMRKAWALFQKERRESGRIDRWLIRFHDEAD